jgi:hypothetical protein
MPSSDEPTDPQVRAQIYKIVRVYLEIERGLRPPEQLENYLTPAEYRRHRRRPQPPASRPREAVLPTDVGRIRLDRHLPGQITATIPTDPRNVLGAIPADPDHRHDRDELAYTLRAAAKALGTRPDLGRGDEATRRTDHEPDRDVAAER